MCEYFHQDPECKRVDSTTKEDEEIVRIVVKGKSENMKVPEELPGPGVEHADIEESELVNKGKPRVTSFDLIPGSDGTSTKYMINDQVFESEKIPDTLVLGTAEEWKVKTSNFIPHPYHIHINPFQVVEIGGRKVDPPMWKDVVMAEENKEVMIRSRYQVYTGDFVIHCHILKHEDQGMMQRVRIVPNKKKK